MNGATLHAGAAATLQRIKNPIQVARKILENSPHMMLVAKARNASPKRQESSSVSRRIGQAKRAGSLDEVQDDKHAAEHHRGHEQGTVGRRRHRSRRKLIRRHFYRRHVLQTSCRVGDSPLIGCGCYATPSRRRLCTGYRKPS